MQVTTDRESLVEAYQLAEQFTARHAAKAVYANVKLVAEDDNRLTLMACDPGNGIGARIGMDCEGVSKAGEVVLPSRFGSLPKINTDAAVEVAMGKHGVELRADRVLGTFWTHGGEDHSGVEGPAQSVGFFRVTAGSLSKLISRTVYATDETSIRFALAGVQMSYDKGLLVGVATDGRRLVKAQIGALLEGEATWPEAAIVPGRALAAIQRGLSRLKPEDEVTLTADARHVAVQWGQTLVRAQLLEGRFPDWRQVLPKASGMSRVQLPVGPLRAAIRQASIVCDSKDGVGVSFGFEDGTVTIAATAMGVGESSVNLPVSYIGTPPNVSLNHKYVDQFLGTLSPSDVIEFSTDDENKGPVLMQFGDEYQYVVMPLSTGKEG